MKDFLKKYWVYLSIPAIIIVALSIASLFNSNNLLLDLLCLFFFFLPMLVGCVHAWEKKQIQNNPHFLEKKGARFIYKFRSLFIFHGIMILLITIHPPLSIQNTENSDNWRFIFLFFHLFLYELIGIYFASAILGIYLTAKKEMSTKDISFSTGIWFVLALIYLGLSAHIFYITPQDFQIFAGYFLCPLLGSTTIFFITGIITKRTHTRS
ncbi:MAG TPA: hypothetical protein DEP42_00380 [Ruminococcaceae bacterium]|nr:hypothetical protein [Oscillospiraceae bacterium]